jgi:hypothetical protein
MGNNLAHQPDTHLKEGLILPVSISSFQMHPRQMWNMTLTPFTGCQTTP